MFLGGTHRRPSILKGYADEKRLKTPGLDRATAVSGLVGGLELRLVREVKRVGPEIDKNVLFLIYTFIS